MVLRLECKIEKNINIILIEIKKLNLGRVAVNLRKPAPYSANKKMLTCGFIVSKSLGLI